MFGNDNAASKRILLAASVFGRAVMKQMSPNRGRYNNGETTVSFMPWSSAASTDSNSTSATSSKEVDPAAGYVATRIRLLLRRAEVVPWLVRDGGARRRSAPGEEAQ